MNIVLFIHEDSSENGIQLKNIISQNFVGAKQQIFQTFNAFKSRLKQLSIYKEQEIFVLLADSKSHLTELTSLIELLEDKRIILILPDNSKSTVLKAHQFFPRFFTYISDSYEDLCAVLSKMNSQENLKELQIKKEGIKDGSIN